MYSAAENVFYLTKVSTKN